VTPARSRIWKRRSPVNLVPIRRDLFQVESDDIEDLRGEPGLGVG